MSGSCTCPLCLCLSICTVDVVFQIVHGVDHSLVACCMVSGGHRTCLWTWGPIWKCVGAHSGHTDYLVRHIWPRLRTVHLVSVLYMTAVLCEDESYLHAYLDVYQWYSLYCPKHSQSCVHVCSMTKWASCPVTLSPTRTSGTLLLTGWGGMTAGWMTLSSTLTLRFWHEYHEGCGVVGWGRE